MEWNDLIVEKKVFLIIQSILVFIFLVFLILSLSSQPSSHKVKPVCGNGIVERGESSINCCQDLGCDSGFQCLKNDDGAFSCQELKKEDMKEYSEIKKLGKTIYANAYNIQETKKDIELSENILQQDLLFLKNKGFDLSVEENATHFLNDYINLMVRLNEITFSLNDLNKNPDFLNTFYINNQNGNKVLKELNIMKNLTKEGSSKITYLFDELDSINNETSYFLKNTWKIDLKTIKDDLTPIQKEFEDDYSKAETIIEGSN